MEMYIILKLKIVKLSQKLICQAFKYTFKIYRS